MAYNLTKLVKMEGLQDLASRTKKKTDKLQKESDDHVTKLAQKAEKSHTHPQSDIENLSDTLNTKAEVKHTHEMEDVNGLSENFETLESTVETSIQSVAETAEQHLTEHKTNSANPHSVTAEQVGAYDKNQVYTKNETDLKVAGLVLPKGTCAFANLPPLSDALVGDMWNISDEFTTTEDFVEGAGSVISKGSNVYITSDGKWDVMAGSSVAGVKGENEESFRTGNVSLTPENIGAAHTEHTHQQADVIGLDETLAAKSDVGHTHSGSDITEGVVTVEFGGTGASIPTLARKNLNITPQNIGAMSVEYGNVNMGLGSAPYKNYQDGDTFNGSGWNSIAYGNGVYVAVARSYSAYSTDGAHWIKEKLPIEFSVTNRIVFGNDIFIVLPDSNNYLINTKIMLYSRDGINWEEKELPEETTWHGAAFINGQFIAAKGTTGRPENYTFISSSDGISWTDLSECDSFEVNNNYMAYGNGVYAQQRSCSFDGENFITRDTPLNSNLFVFGDNRFVGINNASGAVEVSYDGIHWSSKYPTLSVQSGGTGKMEFTENAYLKGNNADGLQEIEPQYVSKDIGAAVQVFEKDVITTPAVDSYNTLTSSAFGNGVYVALSSGSTKNILVSEDGLNWKLTQMPSAQKWKDVVFGNGLFVAISTDSDKAAYSNDGVTWTESTLPLSQNWVSVAYAEIPLNKNSSSRTATTFWCAVAQNSDQAAYSTDGKIWTATTLPSSQNYTAISGGFADNLVCFFVVASNSDKAEIGTCLSAATPTWKEQTFPEALDWSDVCARSELSFDDNAYAIAIAKNSNKCALLCSNSSTSTPVEPNIQEILQKAIDWRKIICTYSKDCDWEMSVLGVDTKDENAAYHAVLTLRADKIQKCEEYKIKTDYALTPYNIMYENNMYLLTGYSDSRHIAYSYNGINWYQNAPKSIVTRGETGRTSFEKDTFLIGNGLEPLKEMQKDIAAQNIGAANTEQINTLTAPAQDLDIIYAKTRLLYKNNLFYCIVTGELRTGSSSQNDFAKVYTSADCVTWDNGTDIQYVPTGNLTYHFPTDCAVYIDKLMYKNKNGTYLSDDGVSWVLTEETINENNISCVADSYITYRSGARANFSNNKLFYFNGLWYQRNTDVGGKARVSADKENWTYINSPIPLGTLIVQDDRVVVYEAERVCFATGTNSYYDTEMPTRVCYSTDMNTWHTVDGGVVYPILVNGVWYDIDCQRNTAQCSLDGINWSNGRKAVPLIQGGTGAFSAGDARTNLDVYSKSEVSALVNQALSEFAQQHNLSV